MEGNTQILISLKYKQPASYILASTPKLRSQKISLNNCNLLKSPSYIFLRKISITLKPKL